MYQNEKLSQKQLDNLQMSRIDLTRTEWWGRFQEDILILHNPKFKGSWEPYKLKQVLVVLCHQGNGYGAVNTIQQIAFDLNFPSQSLFGRYFKRAVSMSPSDYRATHRVFQ